MRPPPAVAGALLAALLLGTAVPLAATQAGPAGEADSELPSLVWAPLRTGYRFAVAWTTPEPAAGTLDYRVDGGPWQQLAEQLTGTAHLLLLDGLPTGGTLEFQVASDDGTTTTRSEVHSIPLVNAHRDRDPASGKYTLNLLVLANEKLLDRDVIVDALDLAATRFYDATDGWVRLGKVLLVFGDLEHMDGGFVCHWLYFLPDTHACNRTVDVVFTADICPIASACVDNQPLDHPTAGIIMNDLPFGGQSDILGEILVHELGHYAFDMDDLYGYGPGCVLDAYDISIMDDSTRTEFDDAFTGCPNAPDLPFTYVPSWTHLRTLYPMVPERPAGPDPGPVGQAGGAYELHVLTFL